MALRVEGRTGANMRGIQKFLSGTILFGLGAGVDPCSPAGGFAIATGSERAANLAPMKPCPPTMRKLPEASFLRQ